MILNTFHARWKQHSLLLYYTESLKCFRKYSLWQSLWLYSKPYTPFFPLVTELSRFSDRHGWQTKYYTASSVIARDKILSGAMWAEGIYTPDHALKGHYFPFLIATGWRWYKELEGPYLIKRWKQSAGGSRAALEKELRSLSWVGYHTSLGMPT